MNNPDVTTELVHELVPFAAFLGVEFPVLTSQRVQARLAANPRLATVGGGVNGGVEMALADIAAGVAAVLAGGDLTASPATVQSSTNFLRPAHGALTATALVLRPGALAVIDIDIVDGSGTHVATVRQVISVRPARETML